MTLKTISFVDPQTRVWESSYGPMHSITVEFEDGTKGQINTKPETVEKRLEELTKIVGQSGEFTVEDTGNWPDGNPKPLKIKDYPGKPQPGQGGGGGGGRGWTAEEQHVRDRAVNARESVRMVLEHYSDLPLVGQLGQAELIFDWLQQKAGAGANLIPPTSAPVPPSGSGEANTGKGFPSTPTSTPDPESSDGPTGGASEGGTGPGAEGEAAPGPGKSKTKCAHEVWEDAPRAGFEICVSCGNARKKAA